MSAEEFIIIVAILGYIAFNTTLLTLFSAIKLFSAESLTPTPPRRTPRTSLITEEASVDLERDLSKLRQTRFSIPMDRPRGRRI